MLESLLLSPKNEKMLRPLMGLHLAISEACGGHFAVKKFELLASRVARKAIEQKETIHVLKQVYGRELDLDDNELQDIVSKCL